MYLSDTMQKNVGMEKVQALSSFVAFSSDGNMECFLPTDDILNKMYDLLFSLLSCLPSEDEMAVLKQLFYGLEQLKKREKARGNLIFLPLKTAF